MSDDIKTIFDFDYRLIREYFSSLERQGPGSPQVTLQALHFVDNLTEYSSIADIGCGTGGQTMILAHNAPGKITAIDLSPEYIKRLNKNAEQLNLQHKVNGIVGSMDNLPFREEEFDLIWSEGAIYNIGFERGLNEWRIFLEQGGYIAVTENTWFTSERPAEIQKFWQKAYSEIDTISNKVVQMQKAGYMPVAAFVLPENCWTEHYFPSLVTAQEIFLKKYAGNQAAEDFIKHEQYVKELYYKYKTHFGYAFYIGKRVE
jgi:ubiquinone/menaquinone biosynthesis C-methylase UbiE